MDLYLTTSEVGDHAVVQVSGEIDLETASQLGDHLVTVMRERTSHLVLDFSRVTFMDSTGLKVLIATQRRVLLAGGSLALVGLTRPVLKVLTVTGLVSTFTLYDNVESAVAPSRTPEQAAPVD